MRATPIGMRLFTRPAAVASGFVSDNFNDDLLDAAKWTTGNFLNEAGANSTGVTVSETGGQLQITGPTSTAGNHYSGYISVATYDMTGQSIFVAMLNNAAGLGSHNIYPLAAGSSSTNGYLILVSDGTIYLWNNRTATIVGTGPTWSSTTHQWLRLRHGGSGDDKWYVDAAPSTASNPPVPGDWTNIIAGVVRDASNPLTGNKVALGGGPYTSTATPKTILYDGFNAST